MQRRTFLHGMAGASVLMAGGQLFAAPPGSPRLLLVFLRGGYDCANLLIPYTSSDYYELRPNIAVAKPATNGDVTKTAIALDTDWALAPALHESIAPMYMRGEVAFVPFAGTEDVSRSHFETQDSIELGQPVQGARDLRSGFMARLAAQLQGARVSASPIAFTDSLPVAFRGETDIPNVSLKGAGKPVFDARQAGILSLMYVSTNLQGAVAEGLELRQEVGRAMAAEMEEANRGAITSKGFELEAQRMARLMRDQYRLGFVDVGGWDTHVNEGAAEGTLPNNLTSLGRGLQVFATELGAEWKNTVVVVLSEFGRTFRENGNRGTDHGHGSVYWVLGGAINGGHVLGEQVQVKRANLFQDRDYPVLNDYRAMLGGLFQRLWGLSNEQLQTIFPQVEPVDIKLV
ncbi:MAG: DUF1501 domain-containing protein [Steroidobacteraceae bacterium]